MKPSQFHQLPLLLVTLFLLYLPIASDASECDPVLYSELALIIAADTENTIGLNISSKQSTSSPAPSKNFKRLLDLYQRSKPGSPTVATYHDAILWTLKKLDEKGAMGLSPEAEPSELRNQLLNGIQQLQQKYPHCFNPDASCEPAALKVTGKELSKLQKNIYPILDLAHSPTISRTSGSPVKSCGGKKPRSGDRSIVTIQPSKPNVGKIIENLFKKAQGLGICTARSSNPSFEYEQLEKQLCCDGAFKLAKRERITLSAGLTEMNCRAFYGVPYVAELGVKIGLGAKIGLSGILDPVCKGSVKCIGARLPLSLSSSVYSDVLSGGAKVQGGVKWRPRITTKQCFPQDGPKPPLKINFKLGDIEIFYEVAASWGLFIYEGAYIVYESEKIKTASIHLF